MGFPSACSMLCSGLVSAAECNKQYQKLNIKYKIYRFTIMIKTVIYIKAGRVIYKKRKHLDGFLNPFKDNPFNMVVTEVEITRQDRFMESTHQGGLISDSNFEEYSVDVKAQKPSRYDQPLTAILQMRSLSKKVAENEANAEAWLYARSAFLYYIACFIIWVRHSSLISTLMYFPPTKFLPIDPCNS